MKIIFKSRLLILTSILVILCPLNGMGQESNQWIKFKLKSGSNVVLPFDNTTTINFKDGNIEIANEWYEITEIQNYTFVSNADGVEIVENERKLYFKIDEGLLYINDPTNVSEIQLFDLSGIQIPVEINQIDKGIKIVDIRRLSPNVYMLSINGETIKFLKK